MTNKCNRSPDDCDKIWKVEIAIEHDRKHVHMVENNLTREEAEQKVDEIVEAIRNGQFIPVKEGVQPNVVNPKFITQVRVERWML